MPFAHAPLHTENAPELVSQMIEWGTRPDISAAALDGVEERLLAHLATLAKLPLTEADEQAAQRTEDLWLLLGRRHFAARTPAEREALGSRAREWLLAGGAQSEAAFEFLRRIPAADDAGLAALFDEHPPLRTSLLRIWRDQGAIVPLTRLEAAAADLDAAGRLALVEYLAARTDAGADLFIPYTDATEESATCAAALGALWVRGAGNARDRLRAACDRSASLEAAAPLLELAALTGDLAFLDLLRAGAAQPEPGLLHLALFGRRDGVPELLQALADPRRADAAADAWHWLTGETLPRIPRLQLVGDEEGAPLNARPEERAGLIPDLEAARRWWQTHQSRWPQTERRLRGQPVNAATVARVAAEHAGTRGALLHRMLEIVAASPIAVSPCTWVARRRNGYRSFGSAAAFSAPAATPVAAGGRHG